VLPRAKILALVLSASLLQSSFSWAALPNQRALPAPSANSAFTQQALPAGVAAFLSSFDSLAKVRSISIIAVKGGGGLILKLARESDRKVNSVAVPAILPVAGKSNGTGAPVLPRRAGHVKAEDAYQARLDQEHAFKNRSGLKPRGPIATLNKEGDDGLTASPTEIPSFDETMRAKGWGVFDSRSMPVSKYADEIAAAYHRTFEKSGSPEGTGTRFFIVIDGKQTRYEMNVELEPHVEQAVKEWMKETLQRLQTLFPEEDLELGRVSVGMNWDLIATRARPIRAHIDTGGTYLHATNTLYGASSWVYPNTATPREYMGGFITSPLGEPLIAPTGTTVVITGADRAMALEGEVEGTPHSSPGKAVGDPNKRLTLFLGIQSRKSIIEVRQVNEAVTMLSGSDAKQTVFLGEPTLRTVLEAAGIPNALWNRFSYIVGDQLVLPKSESAFDHPVNFLVELWPRDRVSRPTRRAPPPLKRHLEAAFDPKTERINLPALLERLAENERPALAAWLEHEFSLKILFDPAGNPTISGDDSEVFDRHQTTANQSIERKKKRARGFAPIALIAATAGIAFLLASALIQPLAAAQRSVQQIPKGSNAGSRCFSASAADFPRPIESALRYRRPLASQRPHGDETCPCSARPHGCAHEQ
jgi:hypothetical protein